MRLQRRVAALEQRVTSGFDPDAAVTFIEMAHGIRDEAWRRGKSQEQLEEAHKTLVEACARFHAFWAKQARKTCERS